MQSTKQIHKDNVGKALYEQNAGTIYEIPHYEITRDEENPRFILQTIPSSLLIHIANGTLDMKAIAQQELSNRGCDINGNWIGFPKSK